MKECFFTLLDPKTKKRLISLSIQFPLFDYLNKNEEETGRKKAYHHLDHPDHIRTNPTNPDYECLGCQIQLSLRYDWAGWCV